MNEAAGNRIRQLEQGFRLGSWEARPHANTLIHCDQPTSVRVSAKAMQVLVQLAAQAGNFVSKDALISTVWRDRVVTEDVLTGAVRSLRRAMNDDARNPEIIETRKGTGYRLIAPVRPAGAGQRRRSGLWWLGLAAAALAAIALPLVWFFGRDAPEAPTIAVLPFATLSAQPRDMYVASALTDGLIQRLAERQQLRVISRTSVLRYTDTSEALPQIARELGADYLVEGSVLTGPDAMRISAQLIDARDDTHVWAQRYDRGFDDILRIQQDVADRIAGRIASVMITSAPATDIALTGTALEQLLEARYLLAQEQPEGVDRALVIFDELSAQYPDVPAVHLGKGQALLQLFKAHHRPPQALTEAADAVTRAIELHPEDAAAHRCLGQIIFFRDWDFALAENHYRRAIELSPSDTVARRRYAWLLVSAQRFPEALAEIAEIKKLDPHYYATADGAMLLVFAGQYAEAVAELERLPVAAPDTAKAQRILSLAYWGLERFDEATDALVASVAAQAPSDENAALRSALRDEGRNGVFRYLLNANVYQSSVSKAALSAQLGDHDGALAWLEQAVRHRDPEVPFFRARPEFAALQHDPRFAALVRRVAPMP